MSKRMNPEIKSKWLAALRSGQYEQARGGLQRILYRDNETGHIDCGYCCLGVLCDLAAQEDVCYWDKHEVATVEPDGRVLTEPDALPAQVMEWAGLGQADPEVPCLAHADDDSGMIRISRLNDSCKLDFNQIADIIEENL
jgi:hypothetical protein